MTNIEDFLQWWDGFRSAIDPNKITKEHLDIIDRKINSLQDLWDISLPSREEEFEQSPTLPYFPMPLIPAFDWPKTPHIWCKEDQQYPRVGTPEGFGTPRHYN